MVRRRPGLHIDMVGDVLHVLGGDGMKGGRITAVFLAALMLSGALMVVPGTVSAVEDPTTILSNNFDDGSMQGFIEGQHTHRVSTAYSHSPSYSMEIKGSSPLGQGYSHAPLGPSGLNRELTIDFWIMFRGSFYYGVSRGEVTLTTEYNVGALNILNLHSTIASTAQVLLPGGNADDYGSPPISTGAYVSLNNWHHFSYVLAANRTSLACYLDDAYIGTSDLEPTGSLDKMYQIGGIQFSLGYFNSERIMYVDDVLITADGEPYDPPVWAPSVVSAEYPTWVAPGQEYSLMFNFNETCQMQFDTEILMDFIGGLSGPAADAYYAFYSSIFENMVQTDTSMSSHAIVDSEYLTVIPMAFVVESDAGAGTLHLNWNVTVSEEPPIPPVASFTASVIEGTAPLTVQFTDTSTGGPVAWEWNFDGDGIVDSTEQHPTITYSHPGVYTVSLRVTNAGGTDYIAKQSYIVVTAPEDETDSYPSVSTEGGIAYSYGDDLAILSGDRIYLYSKWFGSPVGQISDENRAYITLDTRFISSYASSAELTLWFHRNNAGQIDVYSANFGDSLQTSDWGCGVVHGSFVATANVPWGTENPVKVTIDVPIDQINVGGYTQFEIRPTTPGLAGYLYMSTSEHPPTLRVDGVTSNAISYILANGTVHSTNLRPTISDISPELLMYSFDIHVWEGVASVRMEKQDDWELIGFSPIMAWLDESTEYIEFGVAVAPGTYTIQFSVPNKGPVTAHVAIYSSSTGEGFPFETFHVRVSPGTWFSGANARDVMVDSIELNRGEAYTFAVSDHFGNIIATRSVLVGSGTTYISIPVDIHSFKVFNQEENFVEFKIYYEGSITPITFFCAPGEPVDKYLRSGNYQISVTHYVNDEPAITYDYNLTINSARFFMINGTTLSQIISDINGVGDKQDILATEITVINENLANIITHHKIYVAMFIASTGQGLPFESFRLSYCEGPTYNQETAIDIVSSNFALLKNKVYTVAVVDYYGNVLHTKTFETTTNEVYLVLPLDIHSFKVFNQQEVFVKIKIYYNQTIAPMTFYVAPSETVEQYLRPGDYTIVVTSYFGSVYDGKDIVVGESRYFDLNVSDAEFLMIDGTKLSRVITDIQGLKAMQNVVTKLVTPDVVFIGEDMPVVSGEDVVYIHPWAIMKATSESDKTGKTIELWLPYADVTGVDTYIESDKIYISNSVPGNYIWVNTSSGATIYEGACPTVLNLNGGNYTIESEHNITVHRETTFRQELLFYYAYYTTQKMYEVTLTLSNNMSYQSLKNVNWLVCFPEGRQIDPSSVKVIDLNNDMVLMAGEHYDVTNTATRMMFYEFNAGLSRTFKFVMYDKNATDNTGVATAVTEYYEKVNYQGESWFKSTISWTNSYATKYNKEFKIKLNFDKAPAIAEMIVYDRVKGRELSQSEYSYAGNVLTIGLVNVDIGEVCGYDIYFKVDSFKDQKMGFFTALGTFNGLVITPYMFLVMGAVVLFAYAIRDEKNKDRKAWKWLVLLGYGSMLIVLLVLHNSGGLI